MGVTGSVRVAALVVAVGAAWVAGCGRGIQRAGKVAAEPGRARFESYCAACHQYDGHGVGEAPPFEGSAWVTGPEERLIKIVLHGVRGAMVVDGKTYNREMPGFGQVLSNEGSSGTAVRGQFGGSSGGSSGAVRGQSPNSGWQGDLAALLDVDQRSHNDSAVQLPHRRKSSHGIFIPQNQ